MGYRARLGRVPKSEKEKYMFKTADQVEEMLGDEHSCYRPPFHQQLIELGKYFEMTKGSEPFYSFDVYEDRECEFFIMSKDNLRQLIADYHKIIYDNYVELKSASPDDVGIFLQGREREWSGHYGLLPYYVDQAPERCDGFIVSSWQYEYGIFNLVYIYRTFDWENDYLIYSAW